MLDRAARVWSCCRSVDRKLSATQKMVALLKEETIEELPAAVPVPSPISNRSSPKAMTTRHLDRPTFARSTLSSQSAPATPNGSLRNLARPQTAGPRGSATLNRILADGPPDSLSRRRSRSSSSRTVTTCTNCRVPLGLCHCRKSCCSQCGLSKGNCGCGAAAPATRPQSAAPPACAKCAALRDELAAARAALAKADAAAERAKAQIAEAREGRQAAEAEARRRTSARRRPRRARKGGGGGGGGGREGAPRPRGARALAQPA